MQVTVAISLLILSYSGYIFFNLRAIDELDDGDLDTLLDRYTEGDSLGTYDQWEDEEIDEPLFLSGEDRLIIPKIGLDVGILQGGPSVLEDGIWHRYPTRGSPEDGGNFILSGHRFNIGNGFDGVKRSSPLFNIDKLAVGDQIEVVWDRSAYSYEVSEIFLVAPHQIEIEQETEEELLTLYTCTLSGSSDGRVVLRARPI